MQQATVLPHLLKVPPVDEATAVDDYLAYLLASERSSAAGPWKIVPPGTHRDKAWLAETAQDLIVYIDPRHAGWRQFLPNLPVRRLIQRAQTSLLIVRRPRWPIRRILLIVRAQESDWSALAWAERFGVAANAHVSILPVVPPWPSLHRLSRSVQPKPGVLLAQGTPSGTLLAAMTQRLYRQHLSATISLRQGEPDWQIRFEVESGDPDLVIIAAETHSRLLRFLGGELVAPLLRWIDRPLLISVADSQAR